MLPHQDILANGFFSGSRMGFRVGDRFRAVRPFFHVAGSSLSILSAIQHVVTLVAMDRFEPGEALKMKEQERCSHFSGNETIALMLLGHPDLSARKLALRGGWLAASPAILRRVIDELGARECVASYGLSKASSNVAQSCWWEPEKIRVAASIRPHPGVEIAIRSEGRDSLLRIETRLTYLVGIDLLIIQAGMSWSSSNSALPLAISLAGGLGVIAAGPMYRDELAAAIDKVRIGTERPFAINVPLYREGVEDILDLLADRRVPILIASQGSRRKYLERFKAIGTICLHVVASEEHARKAADTGADGLIVVGGEAGGHPPAELVCTLVIGRAVARAVPDIPIILSGGIADGYGLAAALALGADAAQLGTHFMLTPEARLHPTYREQLRKAGVADTLIVGRGFGVVRVLKNAFAQTTPEAERTAEPEEVRRDIFQTATLKLAAFEANIEGEKIEAGQSVGLYSEILPAAEIVRRTAINRLPGFSAPQESQELAACRTSPTCRR